jgi:hypothetical protein
VIDVGSEKQTQRARQLLADGRLSVITVDRNRNHILAICKGDHGTYQLGFNPATLDWMCECPAYGMCAHLVALQLVTAPFQEGVR